MIERRDWRGIASVAMLCGLMGCAARSNLPSSKLAVDGLAKRGGMPPGIQLDRPLSGDDAAAIAFWNNAQLQADLSALGIARGDLIDAGLLRNPRLDMLFPVGAKPFELLVNFPIEVFWQRGRRVEASQLAYEQLARSLMQNGLNTIRDARLAHADWTVALARRQTVRRSLDLRRRIVTLTNARLRAGDIGELDAMAARTEEAGLAEQNVRAEHEVKIAGERLRFVLGIGLTADKIEPATDTVPALPPPAVDALLERAMAARPDLRALEIGIAAATKRAKWERSRLSLVSAQLSSKGIGSSGILSGPGLSAELPIFHRNQGLIARADADVEVASRQYLALKQRVAFEVHDARGLLVQAQAVLERLREDVLPKLQEVAQLAEQQYRNGDVAYLFVLEQSRGLVDAELRVADAEGAVRRGQAQLERSVGSK